MAKKIIGTVVSTKMQNTVVVEVTRKVPHPLYKKLLKHTNKFKADTNGVTVKVGDIVSILEIKPMSKQKHFAVEKIV